MRFILLKRRLHTHNKLTKTLVLEWISARFSFCCSASVPLKMPHTCAGCGDASASVAARRMGVIGLPGCDICGQGFCEGCLISDINPCPFEPVHRSCYGCMVATKASIVRRYGSSPSGSANSSSGSGSSSSGSGSSGSADPYVVASISTPGSRIDCAVHVWSSSPLRMMYMTG